MQNLKQKPQQIDYDAPIKSDKWKNLHFSKDGKSYIGHLIFSSEQGAENYSIVQISRAKKLDLNRIWRTMNGSLHCKNWSHTIQIPWKE